MHGAVGTVGTGLFRREAAIFSAFFVTVFHLLRGHALISESCGDIEIGCPHLAEIYMTL